MKRNKSYVRVLLEKSERADGLTKQRINQIVELSGIASLVGGVAAHPKGGFSFYVEVDKSNQEKILNILRENGFLACL